MVRCGEVRSVLAFSLNILAVIMYFFLFQMKYLSQELTVMMIAREKRETESLQGNWA